MSQSDSYGALALFMDPEAAAIVAKLERMPSTTYSLAANLKMPERAVRRHLTELERVGEVVRCKANGNWGSNWWRRPGSDEPEVPR